MPYAGEDRRSSNLDLHERMVVVETKLTSLDKIEKSLEDLNMELAKYRGMVGMAIWIGGALITAFTLFKDNIFKLFGK